MKEIRKKERKDYSKILKKNILKKKKKNSNKY